MVIMDNTIHRIINLIIITNVNSTAMIEKHNKILPELIMIGEMWRNMVVFIAEYLHST